MAAADRRAHRLLMDAGRELRAVRVNRGLSQRAIAAATGIEQAELSRVERGLRPGVTVRSLTRIGAAVGVDLSLRLFPGGEPVRNAAHARLLARFRQLIGDRHWRWGAEVPLPIPGDRRAWDRLLTGPEVRIGVEGETRPTDMQELQRRLALKKRDGGVDRVILVMPNSEWCRRLLRLNDMTSAFPVAARIALRALRDGRDPGGDAVILV